MTRVVVVLSDGSTKTIAEGVLRIEVGSGLQVGTAVQLSVVEGNVILSAPEGEIPTSDPGVAGALWVDFASGGSLKVSAG